MFTRIHPLVQPHPMPCMYNKRSCLAADAQESWGTNCWAAKWCTNCAAETAGKLSTLYISAQGKLHGLNPLQGPWRRRNSVLTKNVTPHWQLWTWASQVLIFLVTQCSLFIWQSTELNSEIWRTERSLMLIKITIHSYYLTFLFMEFIGNKVSVCDHLSIVLVICLSAFLRHFSCLAPILFSVSLWFKCATTRTRKKQQAYIVHTATLVSPSPSLVMPGYLIPPFNHPVRRSLKQLIQ